MEVRGCCGVVCGVMDGCVSLLHDYGHSSAIASFKTGAVEGDW